MVGNNTLPTYCLQSTAWGCRSLFAREAKPAGLVIRPGYLLPSSAMLLWNMITASPGGTGPPAPSYAGSVVRSCLPLVAKRND